MFFSLNKSNYETSLGGYLAFASGSFLQNKSNTFTLCLGTENFIFGIFVDKTKKNIFSSSPVSFNNCENVNFTSFGVLIMKTIAK